MNQPAKHKDPFLSGISDSHDMSRAFTNADRNCFEDFSVSLLSPVMTFVDRPIQSFNIQDETGYVEMQIRKSLHIPPHKFTRLWVSRFAAYLSSCQLAYNTREENNAA